MFMFISPSTLFISYLGIVLICILQSYGEPNYIWRAFCWPVELAMWIIESLRKVG